MTPQEYLENKLATCSQYSLTDQDKKLLDKNDLEAYLYAKLTSKKFRKWRIGDDYQEEIKQNIRFNIDQQQPIELTWFFGGYKLWQLVSSPEVDWAEFFAVLYYLGYAAPIAAAYPAGVIFKFWAAHTSIMKRMSNIPEEDCQTYRESFNQLLMQINKHLPKNISVELHCYSELYPDQKEYTAELEVLIAKLDEDFHTRWSEEQKQRKIKSSELNIQWQGSENWIDLPEEEKRSKIVQGPIIHDGYCRLSRINEAIRGRGMFDLTATPLPKADSIPIGTTSSSATKFWIGFGVLEQRGERYVDRILSPQQLEQADKMEYKTESIDLVPLKNFKEIRVYQDELKFSS
ncbi:MAG: hypothetical protein V1853_05330 [bacterium]